MEINLTLTWSIGLPILFCVLCTVLIIVPCVTETTDTLIGCALLVLGFIPYKLWLNQSYMPGFLKSGAYACERLVGKLSFKFIRIELFLFQWKLLVDFNSYSPSYRAKFRTNTRKPIFTAKNYDADRYTLEEQKTVTQKPKKAPTYPTHTVYFIPHCV